MEPGDLLFLLVAAASGAAIGWLVWGRDAASWKSRHSECEERVREIEAHYKRAESERSQAEIENTRLKAEAENFDKQIALLKEAQAGLVKEFENTGNKVLREAQEEFRKRADESFKQAGETGEQKIKALLDPVGKALEKYELQVGKVERERTEAYGSLKSLMDRMQAGQEEVRREAQRLGNSLTNAPKARGRWGERALQNVLEQCGLAEHTDFHLEHSLDTEEGRLRPDAIVNVPGQKKLVIDAKVSLNSYQAAFEAEDDEVRRRHLDLHAKAMKAHVQTLGSKGYQSQFEDAPDYVVMFVPGEHFVAAALDHDPELWDFAFRNKVLLATPTNLVAICRTVAQVWRQDQMANEARQIGRLGSELYDRLAKITEDLGKLGTHLGRAVSSYNDFNRSFESRVLVSARKMAEKGIEIGKREIDEVPLVESAPRYTGGDIEEPAMPERVESGEREEASEG